MAFCTHCGAKLPDGARFCTSCGTPVAAAPSSNPAPQPQAPVRQAPQPQAPQYAQPVQPRPTQPVQPASTTTPQGGIVIDAPEGATVTISDGPDQEHSVEAPSGKGEFVLASWEAPQPRQEPQAPARPQQPQYQQPPVYQQPHYPQQAQYPPQQPYQQAPQYPPQQPYQQAPQYPQQYPPQQPAAPNGPMTFKQALNKSKNDIFGQFQKKPAKTNAAPAIKPKRKWYFWLIVVALVIFIIIKLLQIFG